MDSKRWAIGRVRACAEITASPSATTPHLIPAGSAHLIWASPNGTPRSLDIAAWRRLDEGPWRRGQEIDVVVQGRTGPDLHHLLHTNAMRLVLTLDPADHVDVLVGPASQPNGWAYGVRLSGARPARSLPTQRPEPHTR